jgi:MSHA biogenesis protein MshJ
MKAQWAKLAARYDALVLRERWLVAAAVLGSIVLVGSTQFLDPALKRSKIADRTMIDQRALLATLQAQVATLQAPGQDPDSAAQAELDLLKQRLAALGGRLTAMESTLVPPDRMTGLLEDLVGRNNGLRLLSLRTLPVAPVLEKKATVVDKGNVPEQKAAERPVDAPVGLFKHGVEIRLEGSYQDLATYLARLEKADVKLLWSDVSLSADKHPRLELKLKVYTLSLDRTWLIV